MSLKNVLIIVDDIEESIKFYEELFGLRVVTRLEGNVIMSEGLVLQDADVWYEDGTLFCRSRYRGYHKETGDWPRSCNLCYRIDGAGGRTEACKIL